MTNYAVDVTYLDKIFDTIHVSDVDGRDEAEYAALNIIRDTMPDAFQIDVISVRESDAS